jgi:hypothetical protein
MSLATTGESVKSISITMVVRVDKRSVAESAWDATQCGNVVVGVLIFLSLIRWLSRLPSRIVNKENRRAFWQLLLAGCPAIVWQPYGICARASNAQKTTTKLQDDNQVTTQVTLSLLICDAISGSHSAINFINRDFTGNWQRFSTIRLIWTSSSLVALNLLYTSVPGWWN